MNYVVYSTLAADFMPAFPSLPTPSKHVGRHVLKHGQVLKTQHASRVFELCNLHDDLCQTVSFLFFTKRGRTACQLARSSRLLHFLSASVDFMSPSSVYFGHFFQTSGQTNLGEGWYKFYDVCACYSVLFALWDSVKAMRFTI